MEDPLFKNKYQKYKNIVKNWEKDFKKKHNRIPSKHDIRDARRDIRDAYKIYYKLKTSILETTLNDVLSDDGFDISEYDNSQFSNQEEASLNNSSSTSFTLPNDMSLLTNSFSNLNEFPSNLGIEILPEPDVHATASECKEFQAITDLEHNRNAWNLESTQKPNNISDKEQENLKQSNEFKSKLSSKLFKSAGGSFAKRNPRKALKKNNSILLNSDISLSSITTEKDELPDFETFLLQKAKEQKSSPESSITKLKKDTILAVDENWLSRLSDSPETNKSKHTEPQTSIKKDISCLSYGLSNLKVPENITKVQGEQIFQLNNILTEEKLENNYHVNSSDEIISNSEDEGENKIHHIRKRRKILNDLHKNHQNKNLENNNIKEDTQINDNLNYSQNYQENDLDQILAGTTNKRTITNTESSENNKIEIKAKIIKKKIIVKSKKLKNLKTKSVSSIKRNTRSLNKKNIVNYDEEDEHLILDQNEIDLIAYGNNKQTSESNEIKSNTTKNKKLVKFKEKNLLKSRDSLPGKRNTRSSKKNELINENQDDKLILENLRNRLILEQDEITLIPSANKEQLVNAEKVLHDYLNSNILIKQKKPEKIANNKNVMAISKLEEKIKKGRLNENFVTIDMRKKVFVRGKKTINFSKYKKKLWKHQKKVNALSGPEMDMKGCDGGVFTCFKCGKPGHFAQQCTVKGDNLLPLDVNIEDESPFPTLAEAELSAKQKAVSVHSSNIEKLPQVSAGLLNENQLLDTDENIDSEESISEMIFETETVTDSKPVYIGHEIPKDFLEKCGLLDKNDTDIGPIYPLNPDGSVKNVTSEVDDVLKMFGHSNFRKNQDKAIMRILSGLSTLVTLSTGSGKSLCYQLPAYIYSRQKKCITLVISPLVSLMEDQVHDVPSFLNAHCLHTNQTPTQRNKVMEMLNAGEIDILLLSPEAVVAGERSTGFGSLLRKLPPIAFACIDEAHCVSHWSHNFRPSYLMICKVLRKKLGVKTILGLTATATVQTRNSIIKHLGIQDGIQGVISDKPLPDNLMLSVSKDLNRDSALLTLLRSDRFDNCQSIIIYCTRRDECERIASCIRTCMQDKAPDLEENTKNKRKRKNWFAEPYHAGMPASRRRTIQNAFMSNNLRIVVATVAFGMGINKSDIRGIIHYNMPKNFESYVQEVGRAGRDGKISHCHTFLNSKTGDDLFELKRHIFANSIDRHVIRKLLQNIFITCSCNKNTGNYHNATQSTKRICPGHEIAFSIDDTVQALDIPEQNISTLLCYLELDENYNINVLANAYTMCKVLSYGGPKYLKQAAKECPPLAMAIALGLENGTFDEGNNFIEFSVVKIASAIGWNSGVVKYQLKNLEWIKVNGKSSRSPISVNFSNLGFHIKAPGDFTSDEIDQALDLLYSRTNMQEKAQLIQLQIIYNALSSFAHPNCLSCCEKKYNSENSDKLKTIIREYFEENVNQKILIEDLVYDEGNTMPDEQITNDIQSLLYMYPENNFTGRSVARIFHGITSPNFPAVMWSRCKYWRTHCKSDFNKIVKLANYVIVKMRT